MLSSCRESFHLAKLLGLFGTMRASLFFLNGLHGLLVSFVLVLDLCLEVTRGLALRPL